ncbi:hypothetical protein VMF7928_03864 [Vibrio marisflavi CECT 7928]|uniref:Transmembrane protein n=1 Tax=Vibrio marisflavi CECT 7928 TaxID=634439 RepID=A0ABM9A848_9VIBR|nr:hypothetical protein VMF7928_03864 [Vibrio marisflavi CECT 7928]
MQHHQPMNFSISKGSKGVLIFSIVVFSLFSVLGFTQVFIPSSSLQEHQQNVRIGLTVGLMMIGMAAVIYRSLKKLPTCNVTIDDDGIWGSHLTKEGNLVYWDEICSSRHAPSFQKCFYLLDKNRRKLFTVHYQTENYEELVRLIRYRANIQIDEQSHARVRVVTRT